MRRSLVALSFALLLTLGVATPSLADDGSGAVKPVSYGDVREAR